MAQSGHNPEISVILPVYNVGEYLDFCMESLVSQTFSDFEILLVNDGSTDDSAGRCLAWAERDSRVRLFEKKNGGVSSARNFGISQARGKYLAFVDPDDWVEPSYLEKLYTRLEETGAYFAECDLWRYDNRTGNKIYRCCGDRAGMPYTLREHMKYGPTASYKALYRRSLWEKWNIRFPDCPFESPGIYALLVALSGRVESVSEALYYYRRFRENSLVEKYAARGAAAQTLGVDAMAFLLDGFRRCGLYDEYQDTLEGVVKYRLNDILALQFHRRAEIDFRILAENCRRFLEKTFPEGLNDSYITWGGYNLNRILSHLNMLHDPYARFNFSSIVSLAWERAGESVPIRHKNRYREMMLERERTQRLWEILSELRPKFFFLDLMEERFDIIVTDSGCYTASDAMQGAENPPLGRLIRFGSMEWRELWVRSAVRFVARVRAAVPEIRFVILESVLSEVVGDVNQRVPFPNREEILRKNEQLRRCYRQMESLCPDALVFRPEEDTLYFTDLKYEYGAVPSHLNELFNQCMAERIEEEIKLLNQEG